MAIPETLCHPFATAKIVVWPATCSVRGRLIIAVRSSDDATLRACRRRGERASYRCDRDEGKNVFFIPGPPVLDWRAFTRPAPPRYQEIPAAVRQSPSGHRIRPTECVDRGWLRVACLQSYIRCGVQTRKSERVTGKLPWPQEETS